MSLKKLNIFKKFTLQDDRNKSPATATKSPATIKKSSGFNGEKRLRKEFKAKDHTVNALVSFWLVSPGNVFRWEAAVTGPASCPFENGVFVVSIEIPTKYPFKPPKMKFKTKIFHPNINERGDINIDMLETQWSPAWTIELILLAICSVLSDPVEPFVTSNPAGKLYRKTGKLTKKLRETGSEICQGQINFL